MQGPAIELSRVTRRFGDCVAVEGADARFLPGEIHAVVGENGAGKSTLLKLAAGALAPSSGSVVVGGERLVPATAAEAIRRGVGLVYQHFMLCGAFSAIENVILGSEPVRGGRLDIASAREKALAILERAGLTLPLERTTDALTVGEKQRLEILRVLYRGARALLLDEPTAVLSPLESDDLFKTLRRLADEGATVVLVTHRLDEVKRHADRITVMRRGRVVLAPSAEAPRLDETELARAIMGDEPPPPFSPPPLADDAETRLEIQDLTVVDEGRRSLDGVSLTVRAGEIVGVAGVEGNGQRELVRAIVGLAAGASGRVAIAGKDVWSASWAERRRMLGVVLEDRHAEGLLLDATVGNNLVLGELGDEALDETAAIERRIARFDVRPAEPERLAVELSGGNQQKIVLARAMDRIAPGAKAVLVLAQPTRGVDVGAAAAIHAAIGAAAEKGHAVLVVSADLAELKALSHRICVMHRGAIVATFPPDAEEAAIGRAMLGVEAA